MRVGIITDGKFGERAFANIKTFFDAEWIIVPDIPPNVMLDEDVNLNIPPCDLYISYVRHPDLIHQIARMKKPLILGITPGIGLLAQLRDINPKVVAPRTMCSLEPNTGIPEIDEFAQHFGRPEFAGVLDPSDKISSVRVTRLSPCGSSTAGAKFIQGKELSPQNLRDMALAVCHECRAPRFGHTCDKEVSGLIHILALLKGLDLSNIEGKNPEMLEFISNLQREYKTRSSAPSGL